MPGDEEVKLEAAVGHSAHGRVVCRGEETTLFLSLLESKFDALRQGSEIRRKIGGLRKVSSRLTSSEMEFGVFRKYSETYHDR